jgi:hypothetical protein
MTQKEKPDMFCRIRYNYKDGSYKIYDLPKHDSISCFQEPLFNDENLVSVTYLPPEDKNLRRVDDFTN